MTLSDSSLSYVLLAVGITLTGLWIVLGNAGPYLPMNDAPSHIATAAIAHRLWGGDAYFAAHYQLLRVPLPYWAGTLLMQPLIPVAGPLGAFAALVAAYVALLPTAFYLLARRTGALPLLPVAALCTFHFAYWLGEINYILGLPLILLAFACFLRAQAVRSWALVGFVLLAGLLYLCHIYDLAILLGALGAYFLPTLLLCPRQIAPAQRLGAAVLLGLFGLAAYYVLFQHGTDANQGHLAFDVSARKLAHLLIDPFDSPTPMARAGVLLFVAGVLGLSLAPAAAELRRQLQAGQPPGQAARAALAQHLDGRMCLTGAALLGVAYLGPDSILNPDGSVKEGEIGLRFVVPGFLFLLLGLRPRLSRPAGLGLLLLCAAFGGVKLHDAYRVHRAHAALMSALSRDVLSQVPPHSRVLPLLSLDPRAAVTLDFVRHRAGSYVVAERDSYSPHVFAVLGQHPLRHVRWGDWRGVDDLRVRPEEWDYYDYILLQGAGPGRQERPIAGLEQRAQPVPGAQAGPFVLYRIDHSR